MTNKELIDYLLSVEETGATFFTRDSGDTLTVWVRASHGNDPFQWANARSIEQTVGILGRGITPDPQSGHLKLEIKLRKEE
jgi:hypothetical protein